MSIAVLPRIRPFLPSWSVVAIYAAVVVGLWPVPLLNILHVESAAIVAVVAFFVAGLHALAGFRRGAPIRHVLLRQETALAVPWLLLTVTLLWTPNCGYLQGLLFFAVFPVVTVVFSVALAYATSGLGAVPQRSLFILIGLMIIVVGPIYDLGFHPQLYTYNHVFGGVLGPIYDEELAIRPGLFVFRGLTLLWAGWLFLLGLWLRGRAPQGGAEWWVKGPPAVVLLSLLIGLTYLFAAPLGINTTEQTLQEHLEGHLSTEHFDIYFEPTALSEEEQRRLAQRHEYHYARLAGLLKEEVSGRIASYIYPTPEVKAALTGARYTSVAPVWLAASQVHLLQSRVDQVLPHELAHVFSREFGLPVVHGSLAVGLVEGLAVALEPPSGRPDVHDLVAANLALDVAGPSGSPDDLAADVAARLSPLGFWTGRGPVSYTTMGSFVRYLIDSYGVERLKEVYALGNFEEVYGEPLEALARAWQEHLRQRPVVARAAADLVSRRFAIPSLFERRCPHYVPSYQQRYRSAARALAKGDSTTAADAVAASLAAEPTYQPALDLWARLELADENADAAIERLEEIDADERSAALHARLGDAYALTNRPARARASYRSALARIPLYAHEQTAVLQIRSTLADQPDVLQQLRNGNSPSDITREDDADAVGAPAHLLYALHLVEAERYAEAASVLEAVNTSAPWSGGTRAVIEQQRRTWLAEIYYRMGMYEEAEAAALAAASLLRRVGDREGARQRESFAEMMRWLLASYSR